MKSNQENKYNNLLDKCQYYFLCFYVVLYYIAGGNKSYTVFFYIPILIFSIIEICKIIKCKKIALTKHILALLAFGIFCINSCIWSQNKEIALSRSFTVLLLVAVTILSYNYFIRTNKRVNDILKILLTSGLFFSTYLLVFYGTQTIFGIFNDYTRIGEEIDNVNAIGMELAITAIIAVYFGMTKKRYYYLLAIVPAIIALGTASKSAFIYMAIGIVLLILLKKHKNKPFTKTKKIIVIVIMAILTVILVQSELFPTLTRRIIDYSSSFNSGRTDGSTNQRNAYIQHGFNYFIDNPLAGIGIGNSSIITLEATGKETYLHNNYIELLSTVGIIGTTLYYYSFIILLISSLKHNKTADSTIIITLLILSLISDWGVVSYYDKTTYIILLAAIVDYSKRTKSKQFKEIEWQTKL